MQREERDLTQRSRRKSTEDTEKREIVTAIEKLADILPRSLHFAACAPKCGAEEKADRSGRDDGSRKCEDEEGEFCGPGA
jgi:hypothetical protein